MMRSRKGIASWMMQFFITFFAVGMVILLYLLIYGRYYDVHAIIQNVEARRHTINIAQVLLSSDKIIYEESVGGALRFHRGILDKEKLDVQMSTDGSEKESELADSIGYPSTAMRVIIADTETDNKWILAHVDYGVKSQSEYVSCLYESASSDLMNLRLNFGNPWNLWDAVECEVTYGGKMGSFQQEFPVMIKDGEELRVGRLFVKVTEM